MKKIVRLSSYFNLATSDYPCLIITGGYPMNKPTFSKHHQFKHNDFFTMAVGLTGLSLIVSWAVEVLVMELFRLG